MISASDADIPDSLAKRAWEETLNGMLACA
jgi:hypothetical protein